MLIRCSGCEAVHLSRLMTCPVCGRCPGCGRRRVTSVELSGPEVAVVEPPSRVSVAPGIMAEVASCTVPTRVGEPAGQGCWAKASEGARVARARRTVKAVAGVMAGSRRFWGAQGGAFAGKQRVVGAAI